MWTRSVAPWIWGAVLLALGAAVWRGVDIAPRVDRSFFFAREDRPLRDQERIEDLFGVQDQLVVIATSSDIESEVYTERIERLTDSLEALPEITMVRSLTSGPDGLEDARDSPLWSRLLLASDGSSTRLIAFVGIANRSGLVPKVQAVVGRHQRSDFRLQLAGVPYAVFEIRRLLVRDFTLFSMSAVVVFGVLILLTFRSCWIALGSLVACGSAVCTTLLLLDRLGFGIGLLTANLTTIVFVLAQSHVVFLASNEQRMEPGPVSAVLRRTFQASLWSMATTLLGFVSLLFVPAKPLRELGAGGAVGAVAGLAAAYVVFPAYLARARTKRRAAARGAATPTRARALLLAVFGLVLATGILRLDTDPSLLAYFDDDGKIHRGLSALERDGGTSPLELVVRRSDGERLDQSGSYERMWRLQQALESDPAVGTVVSLPVLMAEADRFPLSFVLTWDWTLDLLGDTARGFVTEDRTRALFLLQMTDSDEEASRVEIVERLRRLTESQGFEVPLVGGVYWLHGSLSQLVTRSLVWSLTALVACFGLISFVLARSAGAAGAMLATVTLVPLVTLGLFGWLGVPIDVIAAPAIGVGFGIAADATLHLTAAWRREGDWSRARSDQLRGILRCTGVVAAGFGLFAFSSFPPTRRFGTGVACAALAGAAYALDLLPELGARLTGSRHRESG